jgi:hypothetical protein
LNPNSNKSDPKESFNIGNIEDGGNIFPDETFPEFGKFYQKFYKVFSFVDLFKGLRKIEH